MPIGAVIRVASASEEKPCDTQDLGSTAKPVESANGGEAAFERMQLLSANVNESARFERILSG